MSKDERKLIEKAQGGDVASFEALIRNYQTYVYNIAYRMMGNEEDAKDAAQEALIKVFKSLSNFKGDAQFSTWLYRIVVNSCKDALRKQKGNVYSLDQETETDEGSMQVQIADTSGDPVNSYERKEVREKIQSALNRIPEQNRIVLVLRDIQGYSYEEISDLVHTPVGTVKSRINRGRLMLRDILRKELQMSPGVDG